MFNILYVLDLDGFMSLRNQLYIMTSQFVPSPLPACSFYDQPGIIVPPSSYTRSTPDGQNPAPSSSPCQECAIHNTILQSMAFNMPSMDYGSCPELFPNPSCQTCLSKYQVQNEGNGPTFNQNASNQSVHKMQGISHDLSGSTPVMHHNTQSSFITNGASHDFAEWSQLNEHHFQSTPSVNIQPPQAAYINPLFSNESSSSSLSNGLPFLSEPQASPSKSFHLVAPTSITKETFQPYLGHSNSFGKDGGNSGQSITNLDQLNRLSNMKLNDIDVKSELEDGDVGKRKHRKSLASDKKKGGSEKRNQEVRKRQPEDLCAVCGDRASGYHYNALTCEGCKGFFRRSITNKTAHKQGCKFGGNCEMDTYTRRKCPHCRFKKCKEVGMLEECLLTEIQCRSKRIRRQQKKQQQEKQTKVDEAKIEEATQNFNATSPGQSSIASSPSGSDGSQNGDSIVALSLTEEETKLIDSVSEAFKKYNINPEIVRRWEKYINKESKTSCRLSDITTVHVQVLVEYAKNIPGFEKMSRTDQIALLKGSVFEAMLLRNSCGYHHLRRDLNKTAILDEVGIAPKTLDALLDFFKSIGKLGMDEVEYGLLIAIVIFNSDYAMVTNKDLVEEYQDLYLSALAKYSSNREPVRTSIFAKILAMLTEIRSLSYNNAEIVSSWKKRGALTPLLCEIWDLE